MINRSGSRRQGTVNLALAVAIGKTQERESSLHDGGACNIWALAALGRKAEAQRQSCSGGGAVNQRQAGGGR